MTSRSGCSCAREMALAGQPSSPLARMKGAPRFTAFFVQDHDAIAGRYSPRAALLWQARTALAAAQIVAKFRRRDRPARLERSSASKLRLRTKVFPGYFLSNWE